jgi:hypothetical protein
MANNIKFIKSKIKFGKKGASITLPAALAKELYEGKENEDAYLTITNGILQISKKIPDCVIPSVYFEKQYFIPQE